MGLEARLRLARLYLLTDARQRQGDLAEFLAAAFAGGVDVVRIRQPGLDPEAERAALEVARAAAAPHQALVGVDRSAERAGEVRADLLHLDQADGDAAQARQSLHPWALLGRSTHDPDQVRTALADPALDYLVVGPVHPSADPASAAPGLDLLRQTATLAPVHSFDTLPWFAAGGITAERLDAVLAAGARRICVTRALTTASDPQEAAGRLSRALADAWRADPGSERYTFAAAARPGRQG